MAVTTVPGWIGSSAVTQTGQRWMSAAAAKLGVKIPANMSSFAGKTSS